MVKKILCCTVEKQVVIKLQGLIEGPAVEQHKQSIYRVNNKYYGVHTVIGRVHTRYYEVQRNTV